MPFSSSFVWWTRTTGSCCAVLYLVINVLAITLIKWPDFVCGFLCGNDTDTSSVPEWINPLLVVGSVSCKRQPQHYLNVTSITPLPHSLAGITNNEWSGGVDWRDTSKQRWSLFLGGGIGVEIETKTKIYRSNFPNCDDEEYWSMTFWNQLQLLQCIVGSI